MRIGVIGASGFIGKAFNKLAIEQGHEVIGFSRSSKPKKNGVEWRVFNDTPDFSGLDAIINYAGESVAQRWTEKKKIQFHESRVGVTKLIIDQLSALSVEQRPKVLLNASAVGYYGDCGDTRLDEDSPKGGGYLSDLCEEWEGAAYDAEKLGLRVVIGRIGIVLGKGGAAWDQMRMVFNLGGGGPLGSGKQWMPWVNVADVVGGSLFALENDSISGVANLVSPDPQVNKVFTSILASYLKRPAFMPVPEIALRMLYGEFGKHLLDSYRVYPTVLSEAGYSFISENLETGLRDIDSQ